MLLEEVKIREVHVIDDEVKQRIKDFLQGAVYCWCKNRKNDWFTARELLGGDNRNWSRTPMQALYRAVGDEEQAGKEAGWLLIRVIEDDKRYFETEKVEGDWGRKYRWNGEEDNS